MSAIDRFTTIYDDREDRIRLLVELTSGEIQEFWLTRRLLGRLVQALLKRLDALASGETVSVSASSRDACQRFNQAAAMDGLGKQKPVLPPIRSENKSDAPVLVTKIGMRWGKRVIALDLKKDDDVRQTLSFNEETLRQWLAVVHSQYKVAKWSDEIWPSWMQAQTDRVSIARLN